MSSASQSRSPGGAGLVVRCADRLRLGRAALAQVDREDDHRPDGQELRLPVLQCLLPEVGLDEIGAPRDRGLVVLTLLALKSRQLFSDWPNQVARKIVPITSRSEFSYTRVRQSSNLAQRGPFAGTWRPILCFSFVSRPTSSESLRLVRSLLHQPNGREDEERELEELGLPVLEHRASKGRREHIVEPGQRLAAVGELLRVVSVLTRKRTSRPASVNRKSVKKKTERPFSKRNRLIRRSIRQRDTGRRHPRSLASRQLTSRAPPSDFPPPVLPNHSPVDEIRFTQRSAVEASERWSAELPYRRVRKKPGRRATNSRGSAASVPS